VYIELQPRQSLVPGLAPVSICHPLPFNFLRIRTEHPARDANPACPEHLGERASRVAPFASRMTLRAEGSSFPANPLRIRTSKTLLPQPLYNPHLRSPLGCAGNKRLTGARVHLQLFCNQHLRTPLRSAENTGLIILLESALTKNAPATPLESALPRNRGEGVLLLTRNPRKDFYPEKPGHGESLRVAQPFLAVLLHRSQDTGHARTHSRSALLFLRSDLRGIGTNNV
jgi:hypothetical protein